MTRRYGRIDIGDPEFAPMGLTLVCDVPSCRGLGGSCWAQELPASSEAEAVAMALEEGWTLDVEGIANVQVICPDCTMQWHAMDTPQEKLKRALVNANAYQRKVSEEILARLKAQSANFSEIGFYCDAHAEALHAAMLLPAKGVA